MLHDLVVFFSFSNAIITTTIHNNVRPIAAIIENVIVTG